MNSTETIEGEIARIEDLLTFARAKVENLRREWDEASGEYLVAVADDDGGDDIAWTNEERMEAAIATAHERVESLEDDLRDCQRALNRAS